MLVPALALVGGLMLYPIYSAFQLSLHRAGTFAPSDAPYVGLDNYREFLSQSFAGSYIWQTYIRSIGGLVPSFLLGLGAALALHQRLRGHSVWRVLILVPFVLSGPVALQSWILALNPQYGFPAELGLDIQYPLSDPTLVWPTLLLINAWASFQFFAILLLAGLQRIPTELYEAASIDGAGMWRRFWDVTIPGVALMSAVACLLYFMHSFQDFSLVYLTTGGGPINTTQTLPVYAYNLAFGGGFDIGQSTAITFINAVIMIATILAVAALFLSARLLYRRFDARRQRLWLEMTCVDEVVSVRPRTEDSISNGKRVGAGRRVRQVYLGRHLALIATIFFVLFSLAPLLLELAKSFDGPAGASRPATFWPRDPTVSNYTRVLSDPSLYQVSDSLVPPLAINLWRSVVVTIGVTALVLFAGLLGGYGLARWRSRAAPALTGMMLAVQLIPAIMLVFPLYLLLAKLGLLDSSRGQIIATAMLFLPANVVFFRVFFARMPLELEEAAMVDGAGPLRVFAGVVLPNARPAIGAAAAFVVINTWNEFLFATTLVTDGTRRTFPAALEQFIAGFVFQGEISPGEQAVYLMIPTAIAVVLLSVTMRPLMTAYQGGGVRG